MPKTLDEAAEAVRRSSASGMLAMMVMMMVCCVAVFFGLALIPLLGWPVGLTAAALVVALLALAHIKLMSHSGH